MDDQVASQIEKLLLSKGIHSDLTGDIAKEILRLPAIAVASQIEEDVEQAVFHAFGGRSAFRKISEKLVKQDLLQEITAKVHEKKSKSLAVIIMEMLKTYYSWAPHKYHDELDWIIKQIRSGNIYKEAEIVDFMMEEISEEGQENILPYLKQYSSYHENNLKFSDENSAVEAFRVRSQLRAQTHPVSIQTQISFERLDVNSYDLNIFELEEQSDAITVLEAITKNVFQEYGFWDEVSVKKETFKNCLREFGNGYRRENPYHNALHAADVLQMCHLFTQHSPIVRLAKLEAIHIFSLFISAIIHDIGHPGFTNAFMVNTSSEIAFQYNDISVLENYHIAEAFRIMRLPECNIFEHLEPSEFRTIRRLMIEMVLATDMSKHGETVANIGTKFEDVAENKPFVLALILHASDISHAIRPFDVTYQWTVAIQTEFFAQGDRERVLGQEVTFVCDRENLNIPKSQVGFISGVVLPFYMVICANVPDINIMVERITENRDKWAAKAEAGEQVEIN